MDRIPKKNSQEENLQDLKGIVSKEMLGMWLMVLEWKVNRTTKLLKQKEKASWDKTKIVFKFRAFTKKAWNRRLYFILCNSDTDLEALNYTVIFWIGIDPAIR